MAYDDAGEPRGKSRLPAELELLYLGEDRVIGRSADSLGVERVGIWKWR
jgi:hypothetical protein